MNYPGDVYDQAWLAEVAPQDHVNPQARPFYHLVVIGGGSAGLISAIGAAGLGAKVALIEKHRMGGDCLNVGCVPSKALLEFTAHAVEPNFDEAFAWLRKVRADIAPHDSVARYSELGVDVFLGEARFSGRDSVVVDGQTLKARRFAICTGARAAVPPIPGLRECDPLTNETVFDLKVKPASIGILGAGAIGCELSQAFARLGVEVHLFEMASRVLPLESEEASAVLAQALQDEGVTLHLGQAVEAVEAGGIVSGGKIVPVEKVVVALGRKPNTDGLSLPLAGVDVDERGFIDVDAKLRTANPRIFSAGDCATPQQFTHHADAQARALVQNALFFPSARADRLIVPHCTYTQPEVASVGSNSGLHDTYRVAFEELDRGRAALSADGFAEVYTRKGSDRILGATIVGPDAGEQLALISVMMSHGLGLGSVQKVILSYPTRAEFLKRLSNEYNRTRLNPTTAGLFRRWFSWTDNS